MRNFDPVSAGPARPSDRRMARWLLRALTLTAITCFACGFTGQKPPAPPAPQQETAGITAQIAPGKPETILKARCYGGRVSRWGNEDCPPDVAPPPPPNWEKRAESREYRNGRHPISGVNILLTVVALGSIGGLIYWLTPKPAATAFTIPRPDRDALLGAITTAFNVARGDATAAGLPGALPFLKIAEADVKKAVNGLKLTEGT